MSKCTKHATTFAKRFNTAGYDSNLYKSMPRRVEAVLKARGGHTKY